MSKNKIKVGDWVKIHLNLDRKEKYPQFEGKEGEVKFSNSLLITVRIDFWTNDVPILPEEAELLPIAKLPLEYFVGEG